MGRKLLTDLNYAHTYSSISLSAKAGNDGYRHLHNLRPSLDRAGRFFD